MLSIEFICNIDTLEISWQDGSLGQSDATDKPILLTNIFKADRELTKLIRWITSDLGYKFEGTLTLLKDGNTGKVTATRGKEYIYFSSTSDDENFRVTEEFMNIFSQTFPGGLIFTNTEGVILEVSHTLLTLLRVKNKDNISISKKSVLERDIEILFQEKNELYHFLSSEIMKNKSIEEKDSSTLTREFPYLDKHFRVVISPVYDKGSCIGSCIYLFDITDEVEKNSLIKEQELMLFNSSRLATLGEMAGGIAHEINNPLAIISGNIQTLRKAQNRNKLTESILNKSIDNIEDTVSRINRIIGGLRTVTRTSSGEDIETSFLAEIFEDVFAVCNEKFKLNSVDFQIDLNSEEFKTPILADRVQISQVLINLISNSYDAIQNEKDKWISVKSYLEKDFLTIRISDSGSGIPKEIQDKMFDPFYTSKEIGKGTGLGLSISKSIMKKHRGDLEYDSSSSHTCFKLNLPLAK